jgi:hypothetical protein
MLTRSPVPYVVGRCGLKNSIVSSVNFTEDDPAPAGPGGPCGPCGPTGPGAPLLLAGI